MANKNRNTKRFLVTKKMVVLGSIAVALLLYFAISSVINTIDTNKKTQKLEQSAVLLDELEKRFKQSGLDVRLVRDAYCWRTGDKYGDGTRICEQRFIALGKDKLVETQIEESRTLVPIIEDVFDVSLAEENFSVYSDTGYSGVVRPLGEELPNTVSCGLSYDAYDDSRTYDELLINVFVFDISCSEPIRTKNIYPSGNKSSWDSYFR